MQAPKFPENQETVQLQATFELVEAMLSAASKLGIQGIFRRLVVAELPDNPWLREIEIDAEEAGNIVVRARHLCPPSCAVTLKQCFTALKIEDLLCKKRSKPYAISSARLIDTRVEVLLKPFS